MPEEHCEFSRKSDTVPFLSIMILTSTPPTSQMQSASGKKWSPAVACAIVSTTPQSAPTMSLSRSLPYPVTATARTSLVPTASLTWRKRALASSIGLPLLSA